MAHKSQARNIIPALAILKIRSGIKRVREKEILRASWVIGFTRWIAGTEARRHNVLNIFVLNSPNDEATEIKAAPS